MSGLALALAVHVFAVVLCIGGVGMAADAGAVAAMQAVNLLR